MSRPFADKATVQRRYWTALICPLVRFEYREDSGFSAFKLSLRGDVAQQVSGS
jgi:hypothetical protein